MKIRTNKGFSLLEILLVITLLSILLAILVTRVNPRNIIYISEDNKREADALTIYQALEQYSIKNNGYPESIKNMSINTSAYICKSTAPNCQAPKINLSSILVPTYFSKISSKIYELFRLFSIRTYNGDSFKSLSLALCSVVGTRMNGSAPTNLL